MSTQRTPRLSVIGAPTSAGAYAPGQERAPVALRSAGLVDRLRGLGLDVRDLGDTEGFRWRVDRNNPRAMNADAVARIGRSIAGLVEDSLRGGGAALVLGGDCTVELGTVAGALRCTQDIGLVYVDLDTDLNTPASTTDGALDWMAVAHLLGVDGTVDELARIGPRMPMLRPDQVLFFACGNIESYEMELIRSLAIANVPVAQVAEDPAAAAAEVVNGWAQRFEHLLIHLDVDVLDFADTPLAENTRRNIGLKFDQLTDILGVLLSAPNWTALTVCELNPDHGQGGDHGDATLRRFIASLTDAIAAAPRFQKPEEFRTSP